MGEIKRFTSQVDECGVYNYVCEDGEILAETYDSTDAKTIANKLNELNDENEELNQKNDLLTLQLDCHKHPLLKENRELVSDLNHQLEVSNALRDVVKSLETENEELKQYKQAVNDVLDSYYQKDLSPIEEILVGGIARELNLDLHYKPKKGDV